MMHTELIEHIRRRAPNGIDGIRTGLWDDDPSEVELLVHCQPTLRQASFEFRPESLIIITIDENMKRIIGWYRLTDYTAIDNAIAWVKGVTP